MEWFWFTVGAHAALTFAYAWIAAILFIGNTGGQQWRANPVSTATFFIFLSCGIGHGTHAYHAVEPWLGIESSTTVAARVVLGDPLLLVWSAATAVVALWYLSIRSRLRLLTKGAPLCEDLEARNHRAAAIHAEVQVVIDFALQRIEDGELEAARIAIEEGLGKSREIITHLLGDDGLRLRPGDLRREVRA